MNAGMSVVVILVGLILLTGMALKGVPILLAAMGASFVFLAITTPTAILDGFKNAFIVGAAGYFSNYFILFLLGALFGNIVEISGAAESIALGITKRFGERFIVVGVILVTALLTFGGVSVFVAFFAIYPLAMSLFRKADIPRRLFAAAYMAGGGAWTMTAPFTPAVQNVIPTSYLGTDLGAAPIAGVISTIFCAVFTCAYMYSRQAKAKANGEHFVSLESDTEMDPDAKRPPFILAIAPMILLLVLLNVFKMPIESSMFITLAASLVVYFPYYPHDMKFILQKLGTGASGSVNVIVNTAATVGFGKVVSSSAAFTALIPIVTDLPGHPLIAAGIAVTLLAGMCGSSSGGLGVAIPIISEIYLPMGVNPAALHRVASVACSGLDSLPHCGFVVTTLNYSHTSHKEGYFDIFVCTVVATLLQLAIVLTLCVTGIV